MGICNVYLTDASRVVYEVLEVLSARQRLSHMLKERFVQNLFIAIIANIRLLETYPRR